MENVINEEKKQVISTFLCDRDFQKKLQELNYSINVECNPIILLESDTQIMIGTIENYNYENKTLTLASNAKDKSIKFSLDKKNDKTFSYSISDQESIITLSSSNNGMTIEKNNGNNHICMSFNKYQMSLEASLENEIKYELKIDPTCSKNIYYNIIESNNDSRICYQASPVEDIRTDILSSTLVSKLIGRDINLNEMINGVVNSKQVQALINYAIRELSIDSPEIEKILSEKFNMNRYLEDNTNSEDVNIVIRSFLDTKNSTLIDKKTAKVYRKGINN